MQCEICDAIKRLGLDPSVHDLWYCCEFQPAGLQRCSLVLLNAFLRKAATLQRVIFHSLFQAAQHLLGGGLHAPAYRRRYITLGL